jgi:glycosyltransferase involved in cell wall biosynthesis/SAM-dependent methyltransferase
MKRYDSVCTICGARDLLPFGQRTDGIRVLRCAVCGHGIVEHFQDNVQSLYEDEYFSAVPDSAIGYEDYAAGAEQGVAWAASLLRILKPGGQVLDIGCADGRALQLLGEGYDCFGIELNDSMAQQATQAGVRIIARDLLDSSVEQRYAGCFDAVLSIAVFEHIPDFKEAFRTATALLKPDGILIFEVPVVQFAGDVWYRSSLEHIHYPTESSIEYLFREILHLPLTGSVIDVQDFGGTYIGVTSPDAETARRAGYEYLRLTTSDPALLHGDEARFRWYLDLMHAAHSRPEILALYRHLKPEDWTAPSLHRLFELWAYREDKMTRIIEAQPREVELKTRQFAELMTTRQQELEDFARAKNWLEEQVRNWQQVAGQRQETLVAYEAAKAWLEGQVQNWQQVAGQRQETLRAYLEEQVRSWRQVAGQRQETLVAYEAGKARLEAEVRNWQQVAGQRQETLAAYEAGKAGLEEQVRNWQQVAGQRQETLAAYEAGKAGLEAEVRNWQQTSEVQRLRIAELESGKLALEGQLEDLARLEQELSRWQQIAGEAQESLARLEGRVNYLRAELEYWHQTAEERDRWIAELEKAKTWLAQHGDNWEAAAEQRSERIAVLEETIARMRATRAWRTAEWSVGVWRRISGICRGIILVGSPRLASSNAKNFLLGLKLIFGGGERRAIWGAHFDADYYKSAHPDVARSGIHPWLHYLLCGYFENRNPSGSFDSAYYRSRYSDVRDAGINPLLHYAVFGRQEQRSQAPPLTPAAAKLPFPVPLETRPHRALFAAETAPHLEDNEAPLVSVVIPCFNYGQYVEQAIHSVLSQTFTNLEIIVVEGGSTDGTTPEVLRDLERRGLPGTRFVYRTESHLAGDNRNFGIGLARGRYVCCLDADDLIKPTYLEIAVFLAEFCGYDMVYPSVSCFGESDFRWLLCDPTWPEIADGNQTSTVAMLRRAAWEHAGGFRDWGKGERHVPEDWEFWVRLVGHGFRGKSIREPLMLYRAHGGGLWTTCGSTVEYHRQAIREANPQFFVDGFVPATASLERPAASWDNLMEPAGSHPPILIALPFITIGGAEKVFETLARSLIRRGYKVVVITTLVLAETIRDCTESFEAITPYLYPLPRVLQNQEDRWRDFLFYLLKRHQIGMILIAGCDFVYRLLPEITREFPQIAILDQLFNDEVHYHTNRRCAAYIDATFVPSPKLADKLISECGEQADKICVIPHGINIEEMAAPDAEFDSSRLPQHFRGKFLVSFFGRLSTEKAPADFVEIARRLRSYDEICFLMTGEGQERAAVLALIERYEMQDRIHAPGFVDNVRTLMALSDVVVVPSSLDGMPLVVFEAQACGKPVVASSVGSIPYVIADGETGLLCTPGDVNGFAERILKLWRSPELRRAIGDAARIWVRANHSAESMTSRYVEAFDRARSRARRTAATNCTGE